MADGSELGPLGVRGAVSALVGAAPVAEPAEQLDLLAQRPAGRRLVSDQEIAAEVERTGKAGRPRGAQNLATRQLKDWIVQLVGGTPQERRARWLMLEPEELAKRLGCTPLEAFDRQDRILQDLGTYFMAKLAPTDEQGRAVPGVALFIGDRQVNAAGGPAQAPWLRSFEPVDEAEQYQSLSDGGADRSPLDTSSVGEMR